MPGSWELDMLDTPDMAEPQDMSGEPDMAPTCTPGEEDCACDARGDCDDGLSCIDDVCAPTPKSPCEADEHVVDGACEACAPGTTRDAGDDPNGEDTSCAPILCGEDEFVDGNACVTCAAGSTNPAGDDASGADTSCTATLCPQDHRVSSNRCVPCQSGTTRQEGDDATGQNTTCDAITCGQDERVANNACVLCAPGTQNAPGDDASGSNTSCDPVYCGQDEYVSNNACVSCPSDSFNEPGDDASGPDTACNGFCNQDEYVSNNVCTPCSVGTQNAAGDNPTGSNTTCDPILCGQDEYVASNLCTSCAPGTENTQGDDASGSDTSCDVIFCGPDAFVSSNTCTACAPGSVNAPGDDASGQDTTCDPILCAQDEYVASNACVTCPAGTTNTAGDDASGPDTACDPILCGQDEYVASNLCTTCPTDTTNTAGDDASGADTTCEDACSVIFGKFCFELDPTYVKSSNTGGGDWFGHRAAVSGDILVVNARFESSNATGINGNQGNNSSNNAGAVYVFERDASGMWSQTAYLKPPQTTTGDQFGQALDIDGDTVVIGAAFEDSNATGIGGDPNNGSASNSGAAYIFVRDAAGVWSQQAYIKASNAQSGDVFGISVAIDGDTVLVGAPGEASNATGVNGDKTNNSAGGAGAVYVYERDAAGSWTESAYLKASNTDASDRFGQHVDIDGDTIAVGATEERSNATGVDGDQTNDAIANAGAAYVFTKDAAGDWSQQAYIKASNTDLDDWFGYWVAIDGDTLAVSASREQSSATGINGDQSDDSADRAGAAYVFVRDAAGTWTQQAYIKASNTGAGDRFGINVVLHGDRLFVGTPLEDGSGTGFFAISDDLAENAGAVYVYERDATGTWAEIAYLKAPNTGAFDEFGSGIAFDGRWLVCGALGEKSNATGVDGDQTNNALTKAGAAFLYDLGP